MSAHERFESLAGAIALGEATADERDAFAAHAAVCEACRQNAELLPLFATKMASARDGETWRPSVDRAVLARIAESRGKRSRFTVGALGWAVALSIVLNVAFVSGVAGRLAGTFEPSGEPVGDVASTRIDIERATPHRTHVPVAHVEPESRGPSRFALTHRGHKHRVVPARVPAEADGAGAISDTGERAASVLSKQNAVASATNPEAGTVAVPDVLDGLDIDRDAAGAKRVATLPSLSCDETIGVLPNAESCPTPSADPPR